MPNNESNSKKAASKPKHREIYDYLRSQIEGGSVSPGARLPTEEELAKRFSTSRPTAARALNDLEADGFIQRRVGAGSFVNEKARDAAAGLTFGLLIPNLGEAEIFDPICGHIAAEAAIHHAHLLWGSGSQDHVGDKDSPSERFKEVCRDLVEQHVHGVFFAPLEIEQDSAEVNEWIIGELQSAGIPIVLLDRDFRNYPERSRFDLVGINNHRAGFLLANHLIQSGSERLRFVARPESAATVQQRIAGFRQAVLERGWPIGKNGVFLGNPADAGFVEQVMPSRGDRTGIICANDMTAGELLTTAGDLGKTAPADFLLGSFDNVRYARLFRPPLTTIHQPCEHIGKAAFHTMVSRIQDPDLPAREISLDGRLVIRKSSTPDSGKKAAAHKPKRSKSPKAKKGK